MSVRTTEFSADPTAAYEIAVEQSPTCDCTVDIVIREQATPQLAARLPHIIIRDLHEENLQNFIDSLVVAIDNIRREREGAALQLLIDDRDIEQTQRMDLLSRCAS